MLAPWLVPEREQMGLLTSNVLTSHKLGTMDGLKEC